MKGGEEMRGQEKKGRLTEWGNQEKREIENDTLYHVHPVKQAVKSDEVRWDAIQRNASLPSSLLFAALFGLLEEEEDSFAVDAEMLSFPSLLPLLPLLGRDDPTAG